MAVLAIVLIIFGIIVLNHSPISVMAHEKVEVNRITNMTSGESNNPKTIEVDGIQFETLVPERMYRLPKYGEETDIQFGVRITNQTSTPYRFELPMFVPEILNPHGKPKQMSFSQNSTRKVEEADIPLIVPGESLEFLKDAKFSWCSRDCVELKGFVSYGAIWWFYNFKPGKYQIRLTYKNVLKKKKCFF
ncbi:hypothetical protein FD725_29005 [Nostoc sp. TCL26-01]|nr:hypothetical protein FD725_29005 [Nostoc sp. TCL26-01]